MVSVPKNRPSRSIHGIEVAEIFRHEFACVLGVDLSLLLRSSIAQSAAIVSRSLVM